MTTIHIMKAFRKDDVTLIADGPDIQPGEPQETFEHDAKAILQFLESAIPSGTTDRLFELIANRNNNERHYSGCICADCSGAELTAEND